MRKHHDDFPNCELHASNTLVLRNELPEKPPLSDYPTIAYGKNFDQDFRQIDASKTKLTAKFCTIKLVSASWALRQ